MGRRRRNTFEVIEDEFSDLALDEQARLLAVLNGLHRQKQRHGAALADKETSASQPRHGNESGSASARGLFDANSAIVRAQPDWEPMDDGAADKDKEQA